MSENPEDDIWYEWKHIRDMLARTERTQKDLASAMGVAPSAVSRLLNGRRYLRAEEIPLIRRFFEHVNETHVSRRRERYEDQGWRRDQQKAAERLQWAIAASGTELTALAAAASMTAERLEAIRTARGDFPHESVWLELARLIGVPADWFLWGGEGRISPTRLNGLSQPSPLLPPSFEDAASGKPNAPSAPSGNTHIPLYEPPAWSPSPLKTTTWRVAQFRSPPHGLINVQEAYSFYMPDRSLEPRHRMGEILYVNPWRRPVVDDVAVARLKRNQHEFALGYIGSISADEIELHCDHWGTKRSVLLSLADVDRLGTVVGSTLD